MFLAIKKSPILFIFALFSAGLLSSLGLWQLERGQNLELENRSKTLNSKKKIINLNLSERDETFEDGFKVALTGRFIKNMIIFHDNRLNSGQSGYHVFSIFEIENKQSVLMNRGWVKMNLDRRILPEINTSSDLVTLSGTIRYPVKNVYTLAEAKPNKQFPQRVQTIDVEQLSIDTSVKLAEYSVLLDSTVKGEHFDRNWENLLPGKYMTANKHYAYSLQWFSLALVALVTFMILIYKMAKNEQR